jgi:hypothetical protein
MNKYNIKKNREKLSDSEIQQQMNFDKFMSGYTPTKFNFLKGAKFYSIIASVTVVVVAAGYMVFNASKNEASSNLQPFIQPPIAALDVPSDSFVLLNTKDTTLVYSTGTTIGIPAGAFTDESGNDVTGEVKINYREFHDPIDIMLAGIPMNYDSGGVQFQLESAGMFEISAFQNGKQLKLKSGKNISVNMVSHTNNEIDYNIYYLDTVKKCWDYIAENTKQNGTCNPLFERNPNYKDAFSANNNISEFAKQLPPQKANANAYNFIIDFKKDEFPELAAYNGIKFQPLEGKKKFHAKLSEKTWDDVFIERSEENDCYVITFVSEKETHKIKVNPVVDENNYAATKADYEKRQRKYEAFLANKKNREAQDRDSVYRLMAIHNATALKSNLNDRFNNFIDNSFMQTSNDLLTSRTFTISKLGIWNSDKAFSFFEMAKVERYKAQFVNNQQEALVLKNVKLIRRGVNSAYSIEPKMFDNFPWANNVNILMGISYENELFVVKAEETKNINVIGDYIQFTMTELKDVKSPGQLKQLLKI